ncbi:MAG: Rieske (2Fe-2S) protein [Geothrix sp.]|uniref:Rieske (2Fe-2S) protein n=1 Tax=Geothrix sp. TaxID=1962974 RepID=UPI00180B5AAF|nr:Rieske (2Fe-2S) protein [Geothrix sp.]NWJ40991.1 Rieske (2Fe-2S) protein [Geothrix sp.]WIL21012.1 MAG: Rieske (2Fe-2S) protein [Geothrix sp.]
MFEPAIPDPEPATTAMDRRCFCAGALVAGLTLACGGGGYPTPPPTSAPPPNGPLTTSDTKAGLLATPTDTVRDYRNLGNFFLIRDATGIYAMTAICTHMGCTVGAPIGIQITCPCHGSQYDLNGGNTRGPAIHPLVHFQVTEATPGGALVVNTAQTVAATTRLT